MPAFIAPALGAIGVSSSVSGPLSSILGFGLSFALSILFAPKVPKPEAGKIPFRQSIPPRIFIKGRRRTAGADMCYHATPDGTFVRIQALCEGPANAITRMYLHEDVVGYDAPGSNIIGSVGEGRYGDDKVQIFTRLGVSPETPYTEVVDLLSDAGQADVWTANHRLDGICSSAMLAADAGEDNQGIRFPGGVPVPSFEVDSCKVYEPRQDLVQDWSDPDTWTAAGNNNAILQVVNFLTTPIEQGGMEIEFEDAFLPVVTMLKEQADICDAPVPLKAGQPRPRYQSDAIYTTAEDPGEVLAAMLGTMDGFCCENGDGTFTLKAGLWDDDDFSVVIEDRHIIELNVNRFRPDEDETTGVIVKYTSRDHEYTEVDAPVYPRDAYQGGDDKRVRPIQVYYCCDGYQAQRLAKRVYLYESAPLTGSARLKMWGVQLLNKRGATLRTSDDPDLADVKIRLTNVEPNIIAGEVNIEFTVFDPAEVDAWDATTEEGPIQPPVSVPNDKAFSKPGNLVASATLVGTTIIVTIRFDPGIVAGDKTAYSYRYRLMDIGDGTPGAWNTGEIDADDVERPVPPPPVVPPWFVQITGLPANYLEIQLQAHQHDFSDWSDSVRVDTRFASPGRPEDFSAELNGADVDLRAIQPSSATVTHLIFYRASPSGTPFANADVLFDIPGGPGAIITQTDVAPATGSYDYWAVALTANDVASLERGPVSVTVP